MSLEQLEDLKTLFKLTSGDVEVFQTYFDILAEPKAADEIKRDLLLYDKFISPEFRVSFGGSRWNVHNIVHLVDKDSKMYIKEIDE